MIRIPTMSGRAALAIVFALAGGLTSCISKRVDIVPFVPPAATATLTDLVDRLEGYRRVQSLVLRVDLQFETVEGAKEGKGRKYRTAQGRLLLERPKRIRLNIEAPILSANIAEMASDGERFQLLIHPPDYRAFIEGRNEASYREETQKLAEDPDLRKAGPLVNIRPQHFTDAFLLPSVPIERPHNVAFLSEERVEEPDDRQGAKKGARVLKSYYTVTVVRLGEAAPRARYWFARTGELVLRRQQVYDRDGRLVSDIHYRGYLPPRGTAGIRIASEVRIERPYEDYALVVRVKPKGVILNRDIPETAFTLTVPPEWEETIRRVKLETRAEPRPQCPRCTR